MTARLAGIGDTLAEVFAAADLDGVTPERRRTGSRTTA